MSWIDDHEHTHIQDMSWSEFVRENPGRLKGKRKRNHAPGHLLGDEETHHVELMARIAADNHEAAQWATSVEHGIKLGWKTAKAQADKRVMRGLPDVMCFHRMPRDVQTFPIQDWAGFAIELKVGQNDITTHQERVLRKLHESGWAVCVAHGVEQAWAAWIEYTRDSQSFISGY